MIQYNAICRLFTTGIAMLVPALLMTAAAHAGTAGNPVSAKNETIVHLSQTVEQPLLRDEVRISMRVEAQNPDAAVVQTEINRIMEGALAIALDNPGVDVANGSYTVHRRHNLSKDRQDRQEWVGQQSIEINGRAIDKALAIAGRLQEHGLVMSSLQFGISGETLHAVEHDMTASAFQLLQQRAEGVANAMNLSVGRYATVVVGNVTGSVSRPPMPMMAMSFEMAKGAPAPQAAAGEATVSLTIEAQVVLHPKGSD